MMRALFALALAAILAVAGAVPMTAVAQTPTAVSVPAPQVTAHDAYAVAVSTLAEMRRSVASLRGAIKAAGRRDSAAVQALEGRLAETERGYSALKKEVEAGGGPVKLAEAHAKALLLLKGNKEALAVYERLHIGVAGDLSGTAAGFKCPPGTAPRQKVSSATLRGTGTANDVTFECVPLVGDVVVPEKRSETIGATGTADAARIKASVEAMRERCEREVAESPPAWKQVLGFGLGAVGLVVGSYFGAGAMSSAAKAPHNGLVAAGIAGGAVATVGGIAAATSGGCKSLR